MGLRFRGQRTQAVTRTTDNLVGPGAVSATGRVYPTPAPDTSNAIFVNGISGNDANSGQTEALARKTMQSAIDKAVSDGRAYVEEIIGATYTGNLDLKGRTLVAKDGYTPTLVPSTAWAAYIGDITTTVDKGADIAATSDGKIVVAWIDASDDIQCMYSSGGAWANTSTGGMSVFGAVTATAVRIVIGTDNKPIVGAIIDGDLKCKKLSDVPGSGTWTDYGTAYTGTCTSLGLAVNAAGIPSICGIESTGAAVKVYQWVSSTTWAPYLLTLSGDEVAVSIGHDITTDALISTYLVASRGAYWASIQQLSTTMPRQIYGIGQVNLPTVSGTAYSAAIDSRAAASGGIYFFVVGVDAYSINKGIIYKVDSSGGSVGYNDYSNGFALYGGTISRTSGRFRIYEISGLPAYIYISAGEGKLAQRVSGAWLISTPNTNVLDGICGLAVYAGAKYFGSCYATASHTHANVVSAGGYHIATSSGASVLNGIKIDHSGLPVAQVFSTTQALTLNWCEIIGAAQITNDSDNITATGTIWRDCINGIRQTGGTLTLDNCLAYGNTGYAIATNAAIVDANHLTIVSNGYGLKSEGGETWTQLANSIIWGNTTCDLYCTAAVSDADIDYLLYKCKSSLWATPTHAWISNPLFVSTTTPNYNLRDTASGYAFNSPFLALGSDSEDLGCYQITRTLGAVSYGVDFTTTTMPVERTETFAPANYSSSRNTAGDFSDWFSNTENLKRVIALRWGGTIFASQREWIRYIYSLENTAFDFGQSDDAGSTWQAQFSGTGVVDQSALTITVSDSSGAWGPNKWQGWWITFNSASYRIASHPSKAVGASVALTLEDPDGTMPADGSYAFAVEFLRVVIDKGGGFAMPYGLAYRETAEGEVPNEYRLTLCEVER